MAELDVLKCDRLLDLTLEPNAADLDPGGRQYLIVDLREPTPSEADAARIARWLENQPIPIVGWDPVGAASAAIKRRHRLTRPWTWW